MAKKDTIKALPSKIKYIVKDAGKGLSIFCEEGKIVLDENTSQKALEFVYSNVKDGILYVQIVSA